MRKSLLLILAVAAITVLGPSAFAQGCAMCKTALESSPEGRFLASSFAHGILLLLFLPYVIFGTLTFAVYRAYRKKSKQQA